VAFEQWQVVVVPFPFTDRPVRRRRPALVVSRQEALGNPIGHSVLAMITTKIDPPWPGDTPLEDTAEAGLPAASTVRLKLFTLDNRLITKVAGTLSSGDRRRVAAQLDRFLA